MKSKDKGNKGTIDKFDLKSGLEDCGLKLSNDSILAIALLHSKDKKEQGATK